MKICPKCGRQSDRLLALSRVDNKTMICDECGITEALDDLPHEVLTPQEVRRTVCADDVSEKRRLTLVSPTGEIWLLDRDGTPKSLVDKDDDWYDQFKKLAEYEELEEQGKLLKLSCGEWMGNMRLIDAHQIESTLRYTEFDRDKKAPWLKNEVEAYRHFMGIIENAPTAYDVDKVVKKLEQESERSVLVTLKAAFKVAVEIVKAEKKE